MVRTALWEVSVTAFIPELNRWLRCEWTESAATRDEAFDLALERFNDRCIDVFGEDARYELGDLVIERASADGYAATV